jgi:hypothetical protein
MIMTVIGLSLIATLVLVAVAAVGSETHLSSYDLNQKRAYEAAKAGIDDYAYHLHTDNGYWSKCDDKVAKPHAVNQQGSTVNRRFVPGNSGAEYAIELIPATTGPGTCDSTTIVTATTSMLESLGEMKGTFRIRSTGFAGKARASITATFKPASFLDYVYFTQLETSDPVTYGDEETIAGAEEQCSKTILEGRNKQKIPPDFNQYCRTISFISNFQTRDEIKGPLHTNDALVICGKPIFGRTASDAIEVSSPPVGSPPKGWYKTTETPGGSCGYTTEPQFVGTFRTNSAVLVPPSTNSQLASIAEPQFRFEKQIRICLSGDQMTVNDSIESGPDCTSGGTILYAGPLPSNGVVYVSSGICAGLYSPFETTYPTTSECGNVFIHGNYSGQLTIATENDIVIDGDLENTSEEGMLGLIANNFIRVYHPMAVDEDDDIECKNAATGPIKDLEIDAAILAINHSFIVDNYDCGSSLGTLHVHGAISQKYRGAVGTSGGTGYIKDYVYDDRLHTITPPSFIEPVQSDWVIGRETVG